MIPNQKYRLLTQVTYSMIDSICNIILECGNVLHCDNDLKLIAMLDALNCMLNYLMLPIQLGNTGCVTYQIRKTNVSYPHFMIGHRKQ